MSQWPKISVITPCFNGIHTIRETIESVRSQDYPNLEHLVMDGGSTDGTIEVLKEYPCLSWVSQKDEGHYHAMNLGLQRATGEVMNILNADDCYRPGALRAVGEAFANHPDWDALFGDVVFVDGRGEEIYRREEACYDFNVLRYSVPYVIHPAFFVRKSVHDRLGYFRHKELFNVCDAEFILRVGRAGCRVGHVPRLLINYRFHEFGQSADVRVYKNSRQEYEKVSQEYGKPPGWRGKLFRTVYRGKRQLQKLLYRGRCDLVSGLWKLRRHMRTKTTFSSNSNLANARLDGASNPDDHVQKS